MICGSPGKPAQKQKVTNHHQLLRNTDEAISDQDSANLEIGEDASLQSLPPERQVGVGSQENP